MNPTRGGWFIALSLFFALVLSVLHLPAWWPHWLAWLRPHWAIVFVFFWVLHVPGRMGLIWAWVFGLLLDVLLADPLGLNAAILATVTFVTWQLYERLRMYTLAQQCATVFLMVLGADLISGTVHFLMSGSELDPTFALSALTSGLVWPLVNALMSRLTIQFRVV
ncbi:MAG: rod shape-determining protein MreD [Pseudomonadales bacterium]